MLALDQRGRGESEWAADRNYRRDAYVADLAELVDQLGLERFILMGHSMGGANTLVYTARHPNRVRAAIVEDIGPATSPPSPGFGRISRELAATPLSFASWAEGVAYVQQLRPGAPTATVEAVAASSLKTTPDGRVTWKYDLEGIRAARERLAGDITEDLWPAVRALQCPTLLLRGERTDILAPEVAQAMTEANPRIRQVEIPGASHFVHDDNTEAFNRAVASFLTEVDRS